MTLFQQHVIHRSIRWGRYHERPVGVQFDRGQFVASRPDGQQLGQDSNRDHSKHKSILTATLNLSVRLPALPESIRGTRGLKLI